MTSAELDLGGTGPPLRSYVQVHGVMYTYYSLCKTHNPTVLTCQGPFCIFIAYSEEAV